MTHTIIHLKEKHIDDISIWIVDDDRLIAELLSDFLSSVERIYRVSKAESNDLILRLKCATSIPDIILMDLKTSKGLKLIESLKKDFPRLNLILLSANYQISHTGFLFKLGFSAFLPKKTNKKAILKAIYSVKDTGYYMTKAQLEILRNQVNAKTPKLTLHPKEMLSERETEVLVLVCHQLTSKEVAEKLFISVKTVEAHKSNIFLKTKVKNTAGLVIFAIQNELIRAEEVPLY